MKVIAKPIEMIAWFKEDGTPNPIRFRLKNEDEASTVIKVDKILYCQKEKLAGNNMLVFNCQSVIEGMEKIYELKYEVATCRWVLFKI